ncbi:Ketosteroid isomerase homolog [Streptomyces zhaozhouensis]|uniref:Ketosteroid isomerase homolog n=1 Tax=Streptomyces zhaozhouensis TaxID=1300267 RepID=A0A286DUB5_9ACTN|nr:nuclear transport factor 2 family protein [Streptomyces zhaozhouensis]SOD62248.1 Ketosteroid isomerase homolog [Streptomyces zhaozhouensis]
MAERDAGCQALEARLRRWEDGQALRGLLMRGWRALDHRDWDAWIAHWAEDAVFEFGPWGETRGRRAIRERVEEAEADYPTMQHHILNLHVEVEGDRATGIGYMWFVAVTAPGRTGTPYAMGGPYDWEFRRGADGRWLVTRQRLGLWWTSGEDTGDRFAAPPGAAGGLTP